MKNPNPINRRFVVIRIDKNGSRFLVQRCITRSEAEEARKRLEKLLENPDEQKYDTFDYELGGLYQFLSSEKIEY